MITTTDIANIIYRDCEAFGINNIYQRGNIPNGEVISERVVVISKRQTPEKIWKKNFVEINLCVPNKKGKANLIRLQELERKAHELFDNGIAGEYDNSNFHYLTESIGIEEDENLKCHYVNVRILFEVLNVI